MSPSPDSHEESRSETLAAQLWEIMPVRHLKSPALLSELSSRWCERQRAWHGPEHLWSLVSEIARRSPSEDRDILLLAALYHDAVYFPKATDNEEASARLLLSHAANPQSSLIAKAAKIIVASKWTDLPVSSLEQAFFELDTFQLSDGCPLGERLAYERAIFREYQRAPWAIYQKQRRDFLESWAERFPWHRKGASECMELLASLSPRLAVYPGSFHPFHLGHLSILRQAEQTFDKVIVAIGVNRQKNASAESIGRRLAEVQSQLPFHEVAAFGGLLSTFLDEADFPATVIRGVRDGTDLEAELRYTRFLSELRPGTCAVWIGCEPEYQHLSSSGIRELESIEPGAGKRYVPNVESIYDLAHAPTNLGRALA